MSNRDSLGYGDLLPQDVVEIFAQEKHIKRGRKKRGRSLRRAFSWLKIKKRKNLSANGKGPGLGPALDLALDGHLAGQHGYKGGHKSGKQAHQHGNTHVLPKQDEEPRAPAPQIFQENVFVETSRPKYLEDLHTEALEGLKMMLQEEANNGVEYQDNESTISVRTAQTDGESTGFVTDSTIPDTSSVVSMQSSTSIRSSRCGLTRQGSTFRPLNSGKKSEKSKKRKQRRPVGGIPKHVQREMGLDRTGWTPTLNEEQCYNGETMNGPELGGTNVILEQRAAPHAGHRDDLALLHRLDPGLDGGQRPHSLAVPWMTTASSLQQSPPSPVMTMSPQATYMSKIIPNAVLPPSVEVLEISRGRSRNSVRMVSKSDLQLSSPASSRASSRASTVRSTSSKHTSASGYNIPSVSDNSCWSNSSSSSETLVSDSSTISRSSTPKQKRSQNEETSASENRVISSSRTSNGRKINGEDMIRKDGNFLRSLSVMKSKRAPPPPNRSYSLHSKMKRRSRDLAEVRGFPGEHSPNNGSVVRQEIPSSPQPSVSLDSPGYHGDISSLEESNGSVLFSLIKSQQPGQKKDGVTTKEMLRETQKQLQGNKLDKIVSPSSGYSSQDGASPQTSHQHVGSSPKHKKGFLAKLQQFFPSSPASSPSRAGIPKLDVVDTASSNPSVRALKELFNIPPPPKVHAPPAPPPEVWAHNKQTFLLIFGPPAPDDIYAVIKKNPKDRRQERQSPSASAESSVKVERKHKTPTVESANGSLNVSMVEESRDLKAEKNERLAQQVDMKVNGDDEKARGRETPIGTLKVAEKPKEVQNTAAEFSSPSISFTRVSPSVSPTLQPLKNTHQHEASGQIVSPESCWPPPPPPLAQTGIGGPDEMELPLPPPPSFSEEALASPKATSDKPQVKAEPKKLNMTKTTVPSALDIPPPPSYTAPPPPTAISSPTTNNVSPPPFSPRHKESVDPDVPPQMVKEAQTSTIEVSSQPTANSTPCSQEASRLEVCQTSSADEEAAKERTYTPPQSIPLPPTLPSQLHLSEQINAPDESTSLEPEANAHSSNSILKPPQSIPPPPPIEALQLSNHSQSAESLNSELSPPSEFSNSPSPKEAEDTSPPVGVPLTPAMPEQVFVGMKPQTDSKSTENQSQEETSAAVESPLVTPLILQPVKLRSVNSSPVPPEAQEETPSPETHEEPSPIAVPSIPQTVESQSVNASPESSKVQEPKDSEVTTNQQQQRASQVPASPSNEDLPQKPIRKSLISTAPAPTSPPLTTTSQPSPPKSETVAVSSTIISSVVKSPPAASSAPSMKLQEAIRLRTAARSRESPASRFSHQPSSPLDFHKSPTSTASFIFSKSNKKAGIESKQEKENKESTQNAEVSSETKMIVEAESNKGGKVPPPVAKKPMGKSKEATGEMGHEPEQETDEGAAEKTNGITEE